jgi:hypothetical protein
MRKKLLCYIVVLILLCIIASALQAAFVYPLKIFTHNGPYAVSPDINIFFEVSQNSDGFFDFVFHNDSLVESSIARVYFDSEVSLDFVSLMEAPGSDFERFATPGNLPAGKELEPDFIADALLTFGSTPPVPHNGIYPGQWLQITLDGGDYSLEQLDSALGCGDVRVGAHIISLPDGTSESAVSIPEPITIVLVSAGALTILKKRRH